MARALSRRGRMRSDDERCIQINSLFIEHEVEAKDLAPALYASEIIDSNDRDEILGGTTRLERTRRMIDILQLRGPDAFDVFLKTLDESGYEHVAIRLRSTEATLTPKGSLADFEAVLREGMGSRTSLQFQDPLGERLKKIEDLWDILSRRVTRIEKRVVLKGQDLHERLDEHELQDIKTELAELKTDTLQQVMDLTSANTQKAALIEDLLGEVQEKTEMLQDAQNRIEELEERIAFLETEKAKSLEVVESLREELDQHREHVKHQEDWFNAENLRLKNRLLQQEKALHKQEERVTEMQEHEQRMRETLEEQHNDLKDQRRFVEEQSQQLDLLRRQMMTIAVSNNNHPNPQQNQTDQEPPEQKLEEKQDIVNEELPDNRSVAGSVKVKQRHSKNSISSDAGKIHKINTTKPDNNVRQEVTANTESGTKDSNNTQPNIPVSSTTAKTNTWVRTHRSTFNTYNAAPPAISGVGQQQSSTLCLNVPPTSHVPTSYRGAKRSAPAPLYRAYRKK